MNYKISDWLLKAKYNERLFKNIFALGVLQAANYLLPLLTVPYLVRVLGPEYFGLLAFATATIGYFLLITDYGFNLSATQQISINRENHVKVEAIYSSVMIIKAFLMVVSFVFLFLIVIIFDKFRADIFVYILTFGMVIGKAFFPIWLFQGLEVMRFITYLNISAKLFFTICIFVFIREDSDYLLVPMFNSLGFIITAVVSIYIVRSHINIRFKLQPWSQLWFQLKDGWFVFLSTISISLYTTSTIFILGLFANNTIVGYYSAADRIIQAAKGLYTPVSQAVYPLVGKKIKDSNKLGIMFLKRLFKIIGLSFFVFSVSLFLMSEIIIDILLGEQYEQSVILLKIMSFLPLVVALSNILGIQTMLNLGYKKDFMIILVLAALLGLVFSFILVPAYGAVGTAINLLLVEVLVLASMYFYLLVKGVKFP